MKRARAIIIALIAAAALALFVFGGRQTCRPGDPGIEIGGMLVAGCPVTRASDPSNKEPAR